MIKHHDREIEISKKWEGRLGLLGAFALQKWNGQSTYSTWWYPVGILLQTKNPQQLLIILWKPIIPLWTNCRWSCVWVETMGLSLLPLYCWPRPIWSQRLQRQWSYSYFDATVPLVTCWTDTKMKLIAQWHKLRSILPLFEKVEQSIDFWQDSQSSIIFVWISKSISQIWNQLDFLRLVIPLCGSAWSDCSTINTGENSPIFVTSHHLVEFHADEVSSNSNYQNISIRI